MIVEDLQPSLVVGRFGEYQLLKGWHERETDGRYGIPYRAASAEAYLELKRVPDARTLFLILSGPAGLAPAGLEGAVRIGERLFPVKLTSDIWVLRQLPLVDHEDTLKLWFLMGKPVVPDHVLKNGDARALGWYLSAAWQE